MVGTKKENERSISVVISLWAFVKATEKLYFGLPDGNQGAKPIKRQRRKPKLGDLLDVNERHNCQGYKKETHSMRYN